MKLTRSEAIKEATKKFTEYLMENGGKVIDKVDVEGKVVEKGVPTGLPYSVAKSIARNIAVRKYSYTYGELGSRFSKLPSRRQRRQQADFVPRYNGAAPKTHEEFYGVGYERFNNKFVTIKEVEKK